MTDKGRPPELTNVHLRQLTTAVQSIRQDAAEIGLDLEKMPKQLREKLLGPNLWWAWVYELSMIQHNALHLWSMGAIDQLKLALDCNQDKTQAFFDFAIHQAYLLFKHSAQSTKKCQKSPTRFREEPIFVRAFQRTFIARKT